MKRMRGVLFGWVAMLVILLTTSVSRPVFAGEMAAKTAAVKTAAYGTSGNPILVNGKKFTGFKTVDGTLRYVRSGLLYNKKGFITYNGNRYYVKDTKGSVYTKRGYLTVGTKKYVVIGKMGALGIKRIWHDSALGYYWLDENGVIDHRAVVQQAIAFVLANTKSGQSKYQKLQSCFRALCNYKYASMSTAIPTEAQIPEFASYMFTYHRGNCYRFAAAMSYIAKVLGYTSRVAAGGVTSHGPNYPLSAHGWCEIQTAVTWRVIDCSMQRANWNNNLFCVKFENYPYRIARYKNIAVK